MRAAAVQATPPRSHDYLDLRALAFRTALKTTRQHAEAEDIAQESVLRFYKNRTQIVHPHAWVSVLAKRLAAKSMRRLTRELAMESLAEPRISVVAQLEARAQLRLVEQHLTSTDFAKLAPVFGVSTAAAPHRSRRHHLRQRLRRLAP